MPDYRPALAQFRALPENWNSYGGKPTTQTACDTLLRVAEQIPEGYSACAIVPVPDGGVQLEWHRGDADIELEISPIGEVSGYLTKAGEERFYHGLINGFPRFLDSLREHLPIPAER